MTRTREHIKERLKQAARVSRRIKATGVWPAEYGSSWPDIVQSAWDAAWEKYFDPESERWTLRRVKTKPPIIRPSPVEIDEMDEAFHWLEILGDEREIMRLINLYSHKREWAHKAVILRRRVVLGRAYGVKWRGLEFTEHRSRQHLQNVQKEGLDAIARRLNETPDFVANSEA